MGDQSQEEEEVERHEKQNSSGLRYFLARHDLYTTTECHSFRF